MESSVPDLSDGETRRNRPRGIDPSRNSALDSRHEAKSASHDDSGFRQVRQRAKPLNVERLARKVAQLVSDGSSDNRLNWYTEGRVRVRVSKIIPKDDTPQQTLVGRRKRFHAALVKVLQGKGWEQIKRDVYVRRSDPPAR